MSIQREFTLKTDTKEEKSKCNKCLSETKHKIIANYIESGSEEQGHGHSYDWYDEHQIIQCCGCEEISFKCIKTNSEDVDFDGETTFPWEYITYYPQRNLSQPYPNIEMLPLKVLRIYNETVSALNNDQRILAGIGIRALIEAVCSEQEVKGKNLKERITNLKEKSIVTIEGESALHKLRDLGNASAHEAKPYNKVQLLMALKVVEHMLDGTYIIPEKIKTAFPDKKPKS